MLPAAEPPVLTHASQIRACQNDECGDSDFRPQAVTLIINHNIHMISSQAPFHYRIFLVSILALLVA